MLNAGHCTLTTLTEKYQGESIAALKRSLVSSNQEDAPIIHKQHETRLADFKKYASKAPIGSFVYVRE